MSEVPETTEAETPTAVSSIGEEILEVVAKLKEEVATLLGKVQGNVLLTEELTSIHNKAKLVESAIKENI